MDDSRKPGNSASTQNPWLKDGSGENLGATRVFGTTPGSSVDPGDGPLSEDNQEENSGTLEKPLESAPLVIALDSREMLQEPIVHKVVLSGGPPGSPEVRSSEGLTQLLRALSGDPSPAPLSRQPGVDQRTEDISDSRLVRSESGFTSLSRTQDTGNLDDQPEKYPDHRAPLPIVLPVDGIGDFTALLKGFSGGAPHVVARPATSQSRDEYPGMISPADTPIASTEIGPVSASGGATPGAFTKLLSELSPEATNSAGDKPAAMNSGPANAPAMGPDHNPVSRPSSPSHRPSPEFEYPSKSSQMPPGITDWSGGTAPQPESVSGGGALTQLLRSLEEGTQEPDIPVAHPPALVATNLDAGPSDVTIIQDASKLREIERRGVSSAGPIGPVMPARLVPAQVSAPPTPNLQWQAGVPPNPLPGQPMQFGAEQMPQHTPPAPTPQMPAAVGPAAAMGKMQQYVPLMLIAIIFLLVVILVTVVFLLKH